jgi:hypothetical protein
MRREAILIQEIDQSRKIDSSGTPKPDPGRRGVLRERNR